MSDAIEQQIERFAPGFRDCILARSVLTPADLESHNANLIGGDINGGIQDLSQMFLRPTIRMYATAVRASLSLLLFNPARRRRTRFVRISCCPHRAPQKSSVKSVELQMLLR
jgi:hypothetical protein